MSLVEKLERLQTGQPADISRFAASLDADLIDSAFAATGKASIRRRKLPLDKALWVVIGMSLLADRSIMRVIEHLGLVIDGLVHSSAVTRARRRLGAEPVKWLFNRIAQLWGCHGEQKWRGLSLYGLDGSHMRVDDSDVNHAHFGRPGGRAPAGYPQLRLVALMNLTSRLLTGASVGPWTTGEVTLAKDLWGTLPDNSLTIIDRGFLSFAIILQMLSRGTQRHVLIRLKKNSKYELTKVLNDGSALALIRPSSALRKQHPEIPKQLVVRLLAYRHPRGEPGILMTSLLEPETYPAAEILVLYHKRWELEIAFDELKTHMLQRNESLRSRTVEGVYQEFWGILLVYNLVRREMAVVAEAKGLPPSRISFTGAFLLIQNFLLAALTSAPGNLPRELADMEYRMGRSMILPPRRRERVHPRVTKIKMSNYAKAKPRPGRARKAEKAA